MARKTQRKGSGYPGAVQSDKDRAEFDDFVQGVASVEQLDFEAKFMFVRNWLSEGCPADQWTEAKDSLAVVARYLGESPDFAPIRETVVKRLADEAKRVAPDADTIRKAWEEMIAFSAT